MMRHVCAIALSVGATLVAGGAVGADATARQPALAFESPSGNLRCVIAQGAGRANVRCVSVSPRRGAQLVKGQKARERPFSLVGPISSAPVLPYGRNELYLGIYCRSKANGITCVDTATRRGFRIAREGVVLFPKPAPPPPAVAPRPTQPSGPGRSSGYNCDDFPLSDGTSAQQYLNRYPDDPSGLDRDGDGVACEG